MVFVRLNKFIHGLGNFLSGLGYILGSILEFHIVIVVGQSDGRRGRLIDEHL
jgi:hypothetical protein